MTEKEISEKAREFAKRNKNRIAKELTDPSLYSPDLIPISIFMAGSPGAGKTEFSRNLVAILEENSSRRVIRIDGDEMRSLIPGYTGDNSYLFQGAISLIVEKVHDQALHNDQTFIFDGTFAKYEKAHNNIKRSLEKSRRVAVFYVYQKPEVAWRFTEAREKTEGRRVPKVAFIEQFFGAQETVCRLRKEFGKEVAIFLVKKDLDKNTVEYIIEIKSEENKIDDYIKERYSRDILEKMLL